MSDNDRATIFYQRLAVRPDPTGCVHDWFIIDKELRGERLADGRPLPPDMGEICGKCGALCSRDDLGGPIAAYLHPVALRMSEVQ
jgi:hypothetical protein